MNQINRIEALWIILRISLVNSFIFCFAVFSDAQNVDRSSPQTVYQQGTARASMVNENVSITLSIKGTEKSDAPQTMSVKMRRRPVQRFEPIQDNNFKEFKTEDNK